MEEINEQILHLIESIIKIQTASSNFVKDGNVENLQNLSRIVEQSENEFDILKNKLAFLIDNQDSMEVEAIETENGYEV